ncbi:MAG: tlde1 domain-containing protein [Bacteroidota bacterium]|jgi:hypothetical protein
MADLIFNIATGKLAGSINGINIETIAVSGGRGGSKTKGAANPLLVNNPFLTHIKLKGHSETDYAGSLPMGFYTLKAHETRNNWIRLIPSSANVMYKRDGFAIHGRGPRGSDGCIVLSDFELLKQIFKLIKESQTEITLEVKAIGDLDFILKKMDYHSRLA